MSQERAERRKALRFTAPIPAVLSEGALRVTGVIENLSQEGALLTHTSELPPVGTVGRLRLLHLQTCLRTAGPDTIDLSVQVVRHGSDGIAVEFLSSRERVRGLLERAFGRGAISAEDDD